MGSFVSLAARPEKWTVVLGRQLLGREAARVCVSRPGSPGGWEWRARAWAEEGVGGRRCWACVSDAGTHEKMHRLAPSHRYQTPPGTASSQLLESVPSII